jgi:hypothetical protein
MASFAGDEGGQQPDSPKPPLRPITITIPPSSHESRFSEVFHCSADVFTMYKRKDRKVNPVDAPLPDGISPNSTFVPSLHDHAGKTVPRGSRLTPERLSKIQIGGGSLSKEEVQLFVDILFEFEGAIAFDDSEMGLLDVRIEPPVKAHVVPHVPWQQQNLRLLKAMQEKATEIVKDQLDKGLLEHSQGPYRSRYFLVEKKAPSSWRFI